MDLGDSSDSSNSGEGTGSLTASGGNTAPAAPDAASTGGLLAAASVAAPAAAPSGNLTAVTLATDPSLVRPLCFAQALLLYACIPHAACGYAARWGIGR